jgi:glycosyltransferase involved in cell wall biosynthesis
MRVSVVIPCYNSGPQLRKTVAGALAQTAAPLEIICVDDCSTDDTWATIQELEKSSGGIVRPLRHGSRSGNPATGRNTAIAAALGDWIAFLDHDDLWLPRKLELQAREHAEQPEAGVIHTDGWLEENDDPATRRRMHERIPAPRRDFLRACFHGNFTLNSTAVVRRDWLARVGGLNESPALLGVDDYDLWIRLARLGCWFAFVAEPLAIWRRHGGNLSGNEVRRLRGCLTILEGLLAGEPQLERMLGAREVRARLLALRLDVAYRLIRRGEFESAREELARVWSRGRQEPSLWRLRMELALRDWRRRRAWQRVRSVQHLFRDRSRRALERAL